MGACASRATHAKVAPAPKPIAEQMRRILLEYIALKDEIKEQNPYVLTMLFINKMNSIRACIEALLNTLEVDFSVQHIEWDRYYTMIDAAVKECIRKRFHDGRVRIMADVMAAPGALERLMKPRMTEKEAKRTGSALF